MEKTAEDIGVSYSKFRPFSISEILIISAFIYASILIIFEYLARYVINQNGFSFTSLSVSVNYSNVFVQYSAYLLLFEAFTLAVFISINAYFFITVVLTFKNKETNSFGSYRPEILKWIITNFFVLWLFLFFWTNSSSNSNSLYGSNLPVISDSIFPFVMAISSYILFSIFIFVFFYSLRNLLKHKKPFKNLTYSEKTFKEILKENFLIFYLVNFTIMIIHFFLILEKNDPYFIHGILLFELGINLGIIFFKTLYDSKRMKLYSKLFFNSILINLFFLGLVSNQYFFIYNYRYKFTTLYSWNFTAFGMNYLTIGLIILLYKFRRNLKDFLNYIVIKGFPKIKTFTFKIFYFIKKRNPLSYGLYYLTLRELNNNDQAVYFTKKYIIIQSKHLKNALPGALPSSIPKVIEGIFANDIERLQQLFQINNIKTHSNKAILKFVMITANLIIKDLQKTLQEHLTEELLDGSNDAKSLQINVDELWKKANKIMVQWESTFADSELSYKETLLHT